MRVPEAKQAIEELVPIGTDGLAEFGDKLGVILDSVWLTAYEEGEAHLFSNENTTFYGSNQIVTILENEHGIPWNTAIMLLNYARKFGQVSIGHPHSSSWHTYSTAESVTITAHSDGVVSNYTINPDPQLRNSGD